MKRRDTVYDVSGSDIDIDDRGRVKKDNDADEASRRSSVKKKKRKTERPTFEEVGENTYKKGKTVEKKRKKRVIEGESKQLAVIPKAEAKKKTAKKKAKAIEAIEEYTLIPESGDEFDTQYRAMFEKAVYLAQMLEQQMEDRVNSRDVYALNTLYSQIRELIADMRATRDISQQIAELEQYAYGPFVKQIGQIIIDMYFGMQTNIANMVKNKDIREELLKKLGNAAADQGSRVQEEYGKMLEQARKVLM